MIQPQRNELKTGKRPVQQQIRTFWSGETLFTEGATGRELFIIQEGKVGVYKDGQDGRVELAQVEKGGIIGEMSLLDTLPRSATVIAIGEVKALIIGYPQFQTVMESVPVWLQSIIKIVVSRLRDANRRVDLSVLRDKERGVIALVNLLLPVYKVVIASQAGLSSDLLVQEACFVCRLRRKEVQQIIDRLRKRSLIAVHENEGRQYIQIPDTEAFNLYQEYLVLKNQKKSFRELSIPQGAINLFSNIAYIAQKHGYETDDGTQLARQALVDDLGTADISELDKQLSELNRRGLVGIVPAQSGYTIVFRKESLVRIKKLQEWMPRFTQEVA